MARSRGGAGTNLIEAEALAARVPREGSQESVQLLGSVSERRQVLAQDNDHVRTEFLGLADQLKFVQALRWSVC